MTHLHFSTSIDSRITQRLVLLFFFLSIVTYIRFYSPSSLFSSLRADVSYFLFYFISFSFPREAKEIGDVYTQATFQQFSAE